MPQTEKGHPSVTVGAVRYPKALTFCRNFLFCMSTYESHSILDTIYILQVYVLPSSSVSYCIQHIIHNTLTVNIVPERNSFCSNFHQLKITRVSARGSSKLSSWVWRSCKDSASFHSCQFLWHISNLKTSGKTLLSYITQSFFPHLFYWSVTGSSNEAPLQLFKSVTDF